MKYEDFYRKTHLLQPDNRKLYIEYMDEILGNPNYKTVLFFDEIDTELIRNCWNPDKEKRLKQLEAAEIFKMNITEITKRFNNIYVNWSSQIGLTYRYYEEHKFSSELVSSFKESIENINIDERIKEFIINNNKNTLEQLLIENLIDWSKNTISDVKYVTNYFESKNIEFKNKSSVQSILQKFTDEEVEELKQVSISTYTDLINLYYNDLKNIGISETLQKKIKDNIGLLFEKRGIFKKVDLEINYKNVEYLDYLEKILFDENYKAFLFFEKEDIKLIRTYYDKYGRSIYNQTELYKAVGISLHEMNRRLKKIYSFISLQIEMTYNLYKQNRIPIERIDFFKKNIEDVKIDIEIKKLITDYKLDNIEQYIIKNPINWKKETIRTIKKSLDFLKENQIAYDYVKLEQIIIYNLKLTERDLDELEKSNIKYYTDLEKIKYEDLKNINVSNRTKKHMKIVLGLEKPKIIKEKKTKPKPKKTEEKPKKIEEKYNPSELFKKIYIKSNEDKKEYIKYLEKIFFNRKYKTFLFLDDLETEILRRRYSDNKEIEEISKEIKTDEIKIQKILNNIHRKLPYQIEETFNYYKDNYISKRMMERFKTNIEDIKLEDSIRKFILDNNLNTIEQLLVENPINWSKQPIRDIKEVAEYFEKSGIKFKNKDSIQRIIGNINLTKNEVYVLEKKGLTHIKKIEKLDLDTLEEKLEKLPVLIRKLRRSEIKLNASEKTTIEALKIRYWTGQKIIQSGIKNIGDLIDKTKDEIQQLCNLTDGEIGEVTFRINEFGFEFKKDKQLKK